MTNIKVITRVATLEDMQDLAHLNELFNGVCVSPEILAKRLSDPLCVEQALIAELDNRIVGFAALRIVSCVFYTHLHGELTELYVLKDYRKRGVAKGLLCLAEKIAKEKGVRELFVQTGLSNLAAQAFYHSIGYRDNDLALSKEI
jgi:ribosomal protein S18 acetylase RimI-like enzyme